MKTFVRAWGWVGLSASLYAAAAAAAPPKSEWLSKPTEQEEAVAAASVLKTGVTGRAIMGCTVDDAGLLKDCQLVRENPSGSGFGAALLSLAPKYRHRPLGKSESRDIRVAAEWYPMDTPPDWRKRPTANDILSVFPAEAFRRGQGGSATITCIATPQGTLQDCLTISESPAGAGFGAAAIALTPQFTLKPALYKGQAVPSAVAIPIRFVTEGSGEPEGGRKIMPADVSWAEAPSYADVALAYPKKARAERRSGRATLACELTEEGRLRRCFTISSAPDGFGFDTAAKTLAKQFRFQVSTPEDAKATRDVSVHLPFTFDPVMLDAGAPLVGKPRWARLPTEGQIATAFGALKITGTARVTLSCTVQRGGLVGDCSVASEQPAGAGMGPAALALTPTFRISTWSAEGLPVVGGQLRIPLRYEGAAPPAAAPPR